MSNNLPPIPSSQDKPEETGDPGYGVRRYMLLSRPSHKIRVAILDDHPAITLGLAAYLRNQTDLEVKCVETRADALPKTLRQQPCDVAVVDFYLPRQPWDGMDFIRRLRRQYPEMAIITFSAGKNSETEFAAYRAGANAYLPKEASVETLVEVIRQTAADRRQFLGWKDGRSQVTEPAHPDSQLTTAELEVLRQISQGLSVTQVASRLLRSKKTISTHKRRAMKKLGLADDLALALYLNEKFEQNICG